MIKMGLKSSILAMFLLLLLASTAKAHSGVFDVTSPEYGAKSGYDITQALARAWKDACASPLASKIVVPSGTYKLTEASFKGPCKAPIEFQVQGTLQAPQDSSQITSEDNWIAFQYIDKLTLSGGGTFDGQGARAWSQNDCHKNKDCRRIINLKFDFITNSTIQDITSLDSKNFHIHVFAGNNVTFQHVNIKAPEDSINTDGIHVGKSTGINITHTNIATGDDCVSIGDGCSQITVTDVTCGPGHGISIGSLGNSPNEEPVVGILVKNCTLNNTQNGVRIKTWTDSYAGSVSDVHYKDIIMNNVGNPVFIDQLYCPYSECADKPPSKVKISNVGFENIKGSSSCPDAVKIVCSSGVPCENVKLTDIVLTYTGDQGSLTSQCSNVKPTITGLISALACATSS